MKSKQTQFRINATKRTNFGMFPLFVQFGHKSLEKSQPVPIEVHGDLKTFMVPKDILKMSISDPKLYESIESIEFSYAKKDGV